MDGYHQHFFSPDAIRKYAENLGGKRRNFRVCSLGDEINIGEINYNDPQFVEPFRAWLKQHKLTTADLGVAPWMEPRQSSACLRACRCRSWRSGAVCASRGSSSSWSGSW